MSYIKFISIALSLVYIFVVGFYLGLQDKDKNFEKNILEQTGPLVSETWQTIKNKKIYISKGLTLRVKNNELQIYSSITRR